MTEWRLHFPHRGRDDRLDLGAIADDIAEAITDPQERQVTRAVALELVLEPGIATIGDALDHLEAAGPAGRRQILDRARESAGLLPTERAEQLATYEAANASLSTAGPPRDSSGAIEARCSAPRCMRFQPHRDYPGMVAKVHQRRWFCTEHQHLAAPGDDQPDTGPRLRYHTRTGAIVDVDAQEAERERAKVEAESRRRQREAREAERAVAAAEHEAIKRAQHSQLERESPQGVRP